MVMPARAQKITALTTSSGSLFRIRIATSCPSEAGTPADMACSHGRIGTSHQVNADTKSTAAEVRISGSIYGGPVSVAPRINPARGAIPLGKACRCTVLRYDNPTAVVSKSAAASGSSVSA